MAWFFLLTAAACEMVWPLGFKYTNGFRQHYWAVAVTFSIMGLSLWLMSMAVNRGVPIGTAYAVWTGLGTAGTVTLGIWLFKEPNDWVRMSCLGLIILGVVGLKFLSPPQEPSTAPSPPPPPAETQATP
jgi:quaternary ammonium compound-resistance protein SugE